MVTIHKNKKYVPSSKSYGLGSNTANKSKSLKVSVDNKSYNNGYVGAKTIDKGKVYNTVDRYPDRASSYNTAVSSSSSSLKATKQETEEATSIIVPENEIKYDIKGVETMASTLSRNLKNIGSSLFLPLSGINAAKYIYDTGSSIYNKYFSSDGRISNMNQKIQDIEQLTETERNLKEVQDKYESMKQQAKIQDKSTDYGFKLALENQEAEYLRQLEALKKTKDAETYSWYELFDSQEKQLNEARENIAREQEARLIEEQINQMKQQRYNDAGLESSALSQIAPKKNYVSDAVQSFGLGTATGGSIALIGAGVLAVVLLTKK